MGCIGFLLAIDQKFMNSNVPWEIANNKVTLSLIILVVSQNCRNRRLINKFLNAIVVLDRIVHELLIPNDRRRKGNDIVSLEVRYFFLYYYFLDY